MRKITIALTLVALTTSAQAGWHHHYQTYRWISPVYSYEQPGAAVYSIDRREDAAEAAARQERIRKWEVFCRPVAHVDDLGVSRYSYAHEGCDLGRAE